MFTSTYRVLAVAVALVSFAALGPASNGADASALRLENGGFSLHCSPPDLSIPQGGAGNATCHVVPIDPLPRQVWLQCDGLPPGLACNFAPNPVFIGPHPAASALRIDAALDAPLGTFPVRVVATDGSDTQISPLLVTVTGRGNPCDCEKAEITFSKGVAHGAPKGKNKFRVSIDLEWEASVTCVKEEGDGCSQSWTLEKPESSDWWVDGAKAWGDNKKDGNPVPETESFEAAGGKVEVTCKAKCDGVKKTKKVTAVYKVDVRNSGGGVVGSEVSGKITLTLTPEDTDCTAKPWTVTFVYKAVKKDGVWSYSVEQP